MNETPVQFDDLLTFTRGGGATRVNQAGLIVGVDFSVTSNTIAVGPQTFTLDADLNVNRDWSIGENVIAVAQNGVGDMVGTVTSYSPATQELVIEVATITGSGTVSDWRIGSLEYRRDANGLVREPESATEFSNSKNLVSNGWVVTGGGSIVDNEQILNTFGSIGASKFTESVNNAQHFVSKNDANIDAQKTLIVHAKSNNTSRGFVVRMSRANNSWFAVNVNINTGTFNTYSGIINDLGLTSAKVVALSNGWYEISLSAKANFNSVDFGFVETPQVVLTGGGAFVGYQGDGTQSVYIAQTQLQSGENTSLIPTTTVAVTRPADQFPLTLDAVSRIRQGQGTLIIEAETDDNGLSQKSALTLTGDTGEIRVAKEGVVNTNFSGQLLEADSKVIFGSTALNSGVYFSDGLEILNVNGGSTYNLSLGQGVFTKGDFSGSRYGVLDSNSSSFSFFLDENLTNRSIVETGSRTFNAAHWTGSQFVLPTNASGNIALTNGDSYRIINDPNITQLCRDATHDPVTGRIFLVGNVASIFYSDDNGQNWLPANITGQGNRNYTGVATNGTGIVYVTGVAGNQAVSTDGGLTFTKSVVGGDYQDVDFGNGLFVRVGGGGLIDTSTDGVTWTPATSNTAVTLLAVTYSPEANLWAACGSNSTVLTATDPTGSWTVFDTTTTPQTSNIVRAFNAVDNFNGTFYIGGSNSIFVRFDPVAVTFTDLSGVGGVVPQYFGVANDGLNILAVGQSGAMAFGNETDGFLSRTNNNQTLNSIAYGNNRFISVGNAANGSGYIATIDPDGTVTRRVSGTTQSLNAVEFINGVFYATNVQSAGGVFRSLDDGATWLPTTSYSAANTQIRWIVSDGTDLYAGEGIVSKSTDGGDNFAQVANLGVAVLDAFFANGTIVVVGVGGAILTTIDGFTTFTTQTSGTTNTLRSVIFSERDQLWYAAGDNATLLYSYDAITWQPVQDASLSAISNSTLQASLRSDPWVTGTNRIALSYGLNNVEMSINGSPKVVDTTASIPTITGGAVGATFNGRIKRIEYRPTQSDVEAI